MSCYTSNQPPLSPVPLQISPEVQLWMDMIKHMLECAELTMEAVRNANKQLKFSDADLRRFNELCKAVEKVRQQLVSVGESFLQSSDPTCVNKLECFLQPEVIRRKNCCLQIDGNEACGHEKKSSKRIHFRKNACLCGKFNRRAMKKSKDEKIVVCSPVKKSVIFNEICKVKTEIPEEIKEGEPTKIPEDVSYDDNNPLIIKHSGKYTIQKKGLGYEFFCAMHRYSDRIAQYIDDMDEEQTFAELLRDCISVALKLKENNLGKEDVVCICASNHKSSCVPIIAAALAGCQINVLDVDLSLLEIDYLLQLVRPNIMFVQKTMVPLVEGSLQKSAINVPIVVMDGQVYGYVSYEDYLSQASVEEISKFRPEKVDSLQDTCIVAYTSGTTGDPKAVRLSHYTLLKQFVIALSSGSFQKVFLSFFPYYGIMASIFLGASILGGLARVVATNSGPEDIYRILKKYEIGTVFIGTNDFIKLATTPKPPDVDTSSLQVLATAGAYLKPTYLEDLRNIFPGTSVFQFYVQTEAGGLVLKWSNNVRQHVSLFNAKPASSGMPCGGMWYKIIGLNSEKILGPNQTGELWVKSDALMDGYHHRHTSDVLDESGWLKTGDLAYTDEYHCFYIIDRISEIINFKGKLIPPSKFENILMDHPLVYRAVVLGIPNTDGDEIPIGLIMLKPTVESEGVDCNEIAEFVNEQMENDEHLEGGVKIVKDFPLTPTGKVKRKCVRESLIRGDEQ